MQCFTQTFPIFGFHSGDDQKYQEERKGSHNGQRNNQRIVSRFSINGGVTHNRLAANDGEFFSQDFVNKAVRFAMRFVLVTYPLRKCEECLKI